MSERFGAITMLAVFEHLSDDEQRTAVAACAQLLTRGGRLVLTVPSPAVDRIVHALAAVGLLAGLAIHEHHGFDAGRTAAIVGNGSFALLRHERFQLGLNNLFVFERV